MDVTQDPLLVDKIKGGSGVSVVSSQGFTFPSIPEVVVRTVAAYSQLIWSMANLEKGVTTRDVLDNVKVFFTNPELRAADTLWMSHCAATLRELADDRFQSNYIKYLLLKNEPSDAAQQAARQRLSLIKEWLHNIAHLGDNKRVLAHNGRVGISMVEAAQEILGRTDFTEIDEAVFDQMCSAFVKELFELFKQCVKGNPV